MTFVRFQDFSMQRKMTLLFSLLVLLPSVVFSIFLYKLFAERQRAENIQQYQELLQTTDQAVLQNFSQVESVLEVFSHFDTIQRLLSNTQNRADTVVEFLFGTQSEINRIESYLQPFQPEVTILAPDDNILERSNVFVKLSSYPAGSDARQLYEGNQKSTWGIPQLRQDEALWRYSKYRSPVLPYYIKVYSGISSPIGLVQCSVPLDALFAPVTELGSKGIASVWYDDVCVMEQQGGKTTLYPPVGRKEPDKGFTRVDNGYSGKRYRITLDLPNTMLIGGWEQLALSIALVGTLAYLLMLLLTRIIVNSVLGRLRFAMDAMSSIDFNQRNHFIPNVGRDEVGSIVLAFNQLLERLDEQYEELLEKEKDKLRFQLSALRFQMNPHFLFNSLHWLQLKLEDLDPQSTLAEAVASLGDVYRYNLSSKRNATLEEEFAHIRSYTKYMQAMKENDIRLEICCPDTCQSAIVPRFSLQPIVENAVRHGMMPGSPLDITIRVNTREDFLWIEVHNNGQSIPLPQLEQLRLRLNEQNTAELVDTSIGLRNLLLRLRLMYGSSTMVDICSWEGGTCLTIRLPLTGHNGAGLEYI